MSSKYRIYQLSQSGTPGYPDVTFYQEGFNVKADAIKFARDECRLYIWRGQSINVGQKISDGLDSELINIYSCTRGWLGINETKQ